MEQPSRWQEWTYAWLDRYIQNGYTKTLEFDDLPLLDDAYAADRYRTDFERAWRAEEEQVTPSVATALTSIFWPRWKATVPLEMIEVALNFMSPLLVSAIISFTTDKSQPVFQGIAYVVLMFVAAMAKGVGIAAAVGVTTLFFTLLMNFSSVTALESIRDRVAAISQNRGSLVDELLKGMKVVKLTTMEEYFREKIMDARRREVDLLTEIAYWNAKNTFILFISPMLTSLTTFAAYALLGHELDATTIFTTLSLFALLREPLQALPHILNARAEADVSLNRLNVFFSAQDTAVTNVPNSNVVVKNGEFKWDPRGEPTLQNINFELKPKSLTMIAGPIGCGKSSLLSALLGDIPCTAGSVKIPEHIAYCHQSPWIINKTVRENICFGKPFAVAEYQKVIDACALAADLRSFPNGDLTVVGEKGGTLSGGQKARIALARACYADAEFVILDDVLSALDPTVGAHIMDKCICGLLKEKTIIMVTSQPSALTRASNVIVLDAQGTITFFGEPKGAGKVDMPVPTQVEEGFGQQPDMTSTVNEIPDIEVEESPDYQEERTTGALPARVVVDYFAACGPTLWYFIFFVVLGEGLQLMHDLWLSIWSDGGIQPAPTSSFYMSIYVITGVLVGAASFFRGIAAVDACMGASRTLHNALLNAVLRGKLAFFDTTPVGRIAARFLKDVETLDTTLSDTLGSIFFVAFTVVGGLLLLVVQLPVLLGAVITLGALYGYLLNFYRTTAREGKRLQNSTTHIHTESSPIYAFFGESIEGVSTIRAFHRQSRYMDNLDGLLDNYHRVWWFNLSCSRWLSVRLELIGGLISFMTALFCVTQRDYLPAGLVGLALTYCTQIVAGLEMIVGSITSAEQQFFSVERVMQYIREIPRESPTVVEGRRPNFSWLVNTAPKISTVKYRPELANVLQGLNIDIDPRQKVAVVGRTGSGKSSLLLALCRLVEPYTGSVVMDSWDVSTIGILDLRSKLAVVPQEPVLFSGTVRTNLDPYAEYTDTDIGNALTNAGLVGDMKSLNAPVLPGGQNFSQGERQLLCLARAMLRGAKVLLMDEIAASVDPQTEEKIEKTVAQHFNDCTVISIAHHYGNILNYDKVLVLAHGTAVEFDDPAVLLYNPESTFYGLVRDASSDTLSKLKVELKARTAELEEKTQQRKAGLERRTRTIQREREEKRIGEDLAQLQFDEEDEDEFVQEARTKHD